MLWILTSIVSIYLSIEIEVDETNNIFLRIFYGRNHTPLPGHTANLGNPNSGQRIDGVLSNRGNAALNNQPFLESSRGNDYRFSILPNAYRCDDEAGNQYNTLHRAWIR